VILNGEYPGVPGPRYREVPVKKIAVCRVMSVYILLALFCLVAVPNQGFGGTPDLRQSGPSGHAKAIAAALSGWLPEQMKERGVPGAVVAVVNRTGTVWEEARGVTDGPGSSPITLDTVFNIRSVSKNVTALGVLMAVQDGLVDLDAPISEYLPDFTVHSRFDEHPEKLITLRLMLAHRAGFTHDPPAHPSGTGLDADHSDYFQDYIDSIQWPVICGIYEVQSVRSDRHDEEFLRPGHGRTDRGPGRTSTAAWSMGAGSCGKI